MGLLQDSFIIDSSCVKLSKREGFSPSSWEGNAKAKLVVFVKLVMWKGALIGTSRRDKI